jgi:hypothetical protein
VWTNLTDESFKDGKIASETALFWSAIVSECFWTKLPKVGLLSFGYQEQRVKTLSFLSFFKTKQSYF